MTPRERFEALPKDEQTKILDKHRYWNVAHIEWWGSMFEQFMDDMEDKGIYVDTRTYKSARGRRYGEPVIFFSGFWSQGDGACFNGNVEDWNLVLAERPKYHALWKDSVCKHLFWKNNIRYCHSGTLDFTEEVTFDDCEHDDIRKFAYEQLVEDLTKLWAELVEELITEVKGYCDELYSDLEEEYEYLTSDECVLESLDASGTLEEELDESEDCDDDCSVSSSGV